MATGVRFIDAHTHLYSEEFDKDRDEIIDKARKVGVEAALVVSENVANLPKVLHLMERYPDFCMPCAGVHPVQGDANGEACSVMDEHLNGLLPFFEEHSDKLVAVGECGLDFTPRFCKSEDDKTSQRQVLLKHVELAQKYDLPLNVHSRSAGRPTIALLKEAGAKNVLLHAFDGKASVAMEGVRCGYYFSIPPSIVRSEQKQKLVKQVPLENLLLETDSPALGPEKQVRNDPSNLRISCEYIAQIKKVDTETVARVTWENTLKLFPKLQRFIRK